MFFLVLDEMLSFLVVLVVVLVIGFLEVINFEVSQLKISQKNICVDNVFEHDFFDFFHPIFTDEKDVQVHNTEGIELH